jgi:hypothetical protein
MRFRVTLVALVAAQSAQAIPVPVDVGVGPAGFWFPGPLLENRGAVPHFALAFNLHAILDKEWITENRGRIPARYQSYADSINEVRIGPSLFIPSVLYVSPAVEALNGAGLFGATWKPFGLSLVSTGQKSERAWNRSRGRFNVDANLLLTYLYVYSSFRGEPFAGIPATHFVRPGLELQATLVLNITRTFLVSLGGGAQAYIPQKLGSFFELGPINQALWLGLFASLQFHVRFPYDVAL